jgi:hypothetical protein
MSELAPDEEAEEPRGSDLTVALHSEYWGWDHRSCIVYCRDESQANVRRSRRGARCPHCYGRVAVRSIHGTRVEPEPTKMERFAAWFGGWLASFWASVTYPAHVCAACDPAPVCAKCEAAEDGGEA